MNSYLITGGNLRDRLEKVNQQLTTYDPSTGSTPSTPLKTSSLTTSPLRAGLQLNHPHPDLLIVQADPSVRISHIREAIQFLSRKPYQANIKAIVITEAEKMTIQAQNAFLKTLEEPPADSLIFLSSPNEDLLLPTIISRCQVIRLSNNQLISNQELLASYFLLLKSLLQARVGERLKLIEPYEKNREEAIKFCKEMTIVLRNNLINKNQLTINNQPFDWFDKAHHKFAQGKQLAIIIKSFQFSLDLLKANVNVRLVLDNLVINL